MQLLKMHSGLVADTNQCTSLRSPPREHMSRHFNEVLHVVQHLAPMQALMH